MKKYLLISWLALIFSGVLFLFWETEWKYKLPTPVPANYQAVLPGSLINMSAIPIKEKGKPVWLHFFNPDCPCSRFNMTYFRSLVKKYGNRVSFMMVVTANYKKYSAKEIMEKFDINVPVLFNQSITVSCGVYSTPQAVIIDEENKLYYRGNYNKSRYCTDSKTNYAEMAIDSLLADKYNIFFQRDATRSYGCSLPNCKK